MIKLEDQTVTDEDYKHEPIKDLIRIQKALFALRDIYCSLDECGNIWQNYSWYHKASWLDVPNDMGAEIKFIERCREFKSFRDWASIDDD